MKIICVGRNYAEHAEELQNPRPAKPILFLKPDTALLKGNQPFYHPSFSQEIHYECEVVVRICREGKHIAEKFAHKYYDQLALGVDFTARDLQNELKSQGLPWELSKAFDHSAVVSHFIPTNQLTNLQDLHFTFSQNGELRQSGHTSDMLFSIDQIIAFASEFFTLKTGDLIYTGTPKGVGKIALEDRLEGFLDGVKMFDFEVK